MNISVGILAAPQIGIRFQGSFTEPQSGNSYTGEIRVFREGEQIYIQQEEKVRKAELPLVFIPVHYTRSAFELKEVTIGISFHWERKEAQCFRGNVKIIKEYGELRAINELDIEDYLHSVISSEMSATSSLEFLKAHAVISRSWLLAQQEKKQSLAGEKQTYVSAFRTETSYIRWYDREDHLHFDVCADDHCQRYQGIQRITTPSVYQAIQETRGEILTYEGRICDARFSKCCGGISEKFENVWENQPHPYLTSIYDSPSAERIPDLRQEQEASKWINDRPAAFCNTTDPRILKEVLNEYDRETEDFFRWEVFYTAGEISALLQEKLGEDFGEIRDLIPVERGASGRLIRLKISGTRKSMVIGKELLIRKVLSPTHLYSSAFLVEKEEENGQVKGFRLKGAGWGHGVGLCQIGAAVMGARGYTYREILRHYFPGSRLEKKY